MLVEKSGGGLLYAYAKIAAGGKRVIRHTSFQNIRSATGCITLQRPVVVCIADHFYAQGIIGAVGDAIGSVDKQGGGSCRNFVQTYFIRRAPDPHKITIVGSTRQVGLRGGEMDIHIVGTGRIELQLKIKFPLGSECFSGGSGNVER